MSYPASKLLRIYLGESDQFHGQPLYEVLVERARLAGLAGATVLRGPLGFGRSARLHTAKILRLADDLPLVLEIIDEPGRIASYLEANRSLLADVLVTLENVEVVDLSSDSPHPN